MDRVRHHRPLSIMNSSSATDVLMNVPLFFLHWGFLNLPKRSLQSSSFSSITDSTMSLNIITVTLNMGKTHVHFGPNWTLFTHFALASSHFLTYFFFSSLPPFTEKYNFLGISIVGQSNERGDGGIYIGSIMKGGAVAADGRIEPGDMLLQVWRDGRN